MSNWNVDRDRIIAVLVCVLFIGMLIFSITGMIREWKLKEIEMECNKPQIVEVPCQVCPDVHLECPDVVCISNDINLTGYKK